MGFGDWGLGLGVHSYEFRAMGSWAGFMAQMDWRRGGARVDRGPRDSLYCYAWVSITATLGFRVQGAGAGFRVQGAGCRVWVAGFRV